MHVMAAVPSVEMFLLILARLSAAMSTTDRQKEIRHGYRNLKTTPRMTSQILNTPVLIVLKQQFAQSLNTGRIITKDLGTETYLWRVSARETSSLPPPKAAEA